MQNHHHHNLQQCANGCKGIVDGCFLVQIQNVSIKVCNYNKRNQSKDRERHLNRKSNFSEQKIVNIYINHRSNNIRIYIENVSLSDMIHAFSPPFPFMDLHAQLVILCWSISFLYHLFRPPSCLLFLCLCFSEKASQAILWCDGTKLPYECYVSFPATQT